MGISVNTQVSGGQSPYTYSWDFGDGLTSARPNPIHNYTIPRVYRVEVTVTDSLGHAASQVMNITVIARPVELTFLGLSETTLKVGGFLTAMSAFLASHNATQAPGGTARSSGNGSVIGMGKSVPSAKRISDRTRR